MSVKILGGVYKGIELYTPPESITRPTSALLRRKIFDAYQSLDGVQFVDLCAGSGACGLEAFSRGANFVYFVDDNKKAYDVIKRNIDKIKAKDTKASLVSIQKFLLDFKLEYQKKELEQKENTIIFFDPPYEKHDYYQWFEREVLNSDWFKGVVWLESDRLKGIALEYFKDHSCFLKAYEHSDSYIAVFNL